MQGDLPTLSNTHTHTEFLNENHNLYPNAPEMHVPRLQYSAQSHRLALNIRMNNKWTLASNPDLKRTDR